MSEHGRGEGFHGEIDVDRFIFVQESRQERWMESEVLNRVVSSSRGTITIV